MAAKRKRHDSGVQPSTVNKFALLLQITAESNSGIETNTTAAAYNTAAAILSRSIEAPVVAVDDSPSVSSDVSDATSSADCDTHDQTKQTVVAHVPEWRRNARSITQRPDSTSKSSSNGPGSTAAPEVKLAVRTTKSKNAPQYSDNWCTTKASFKGHASPPQLREHIAFDAALYKHVGGLDGLGKRSSINGPMTKDGESIDIIIPKHILLHEIEHLFKRNKAPRNEEGTRIEERPNGMEVLIKSRMWIVMSRNGDQTVEVPIFTFHEKGFEAVHDDKRHRYAYVRPPHMSAAEFEDNVVERDNPVIGVEKLLHGPPLSEFMIARVAEPEHRMLGTYPVRLIARLDVESFEELKEVVACRSEERRLGH
nr:hypothetical protein B0A51_05549 [Rachicladosporium sp. CCFEE 5018]